MEKTYLQITSGRGPVECCRVVALVLEKILREAQKRKLRVEILGKRDWSCQSHFVVGSRCTRRCRLRCIG